MMIFREILPKPNQGTSKKRTGGGGGLYKIVCRRLSKDLNGIKSASKQAAKHETMHRDNLLKDVLRPFPSLPNLPPSLDRDVLCYIYPPGAPPPGKLYFL